MGVGILAPAVIGLLFLSQVGQDLVGKFRLSGSLDQLHRILMQLQHRLISPGTQVTADQQFISPVTHMGQGQIGHSIDLLRGKIHFEAVVHEIFPRFTRNWAARPVQKPVTIEIAAKTGR